MMNEQEALARVFALHQPKKLWQPHEGYEASFASEEATLDYDDECTPIFFEICAECGRIESEQFREGGEEWGYRESLWPCPTAEAISPKLAP